MVGRARVYLVLAVIGLVIVAAVTLTPAATPALTAGELCKLKGARYAGKTSQGKLVCFTIAGSGKMSEYAFGYRNDCGGSGTQRTFGGSGTSIATNGRFSAPGMSGSYFKGQVSGRTAAGTLRSVQTEYGVVPPATCDTGVVRWNAKRIR